MNLGGKGRRLSVVLVVVAFCLFFTPTTFAHHTGATASLYEEAVNPPRLKVVPYNDLKPPYDWQTQGDFAEEADDTLDESRRRGRLLPALRVIGTVGIAAGIVDQTIGWRVCLDSIVSGVCPGAWIYRQLTGESYGGSLALIGTPQWVYTAGPEGWPGFPGSPYTEWWKLRSTGNWGPIVCIAECGTSSQANAQEQLGAVGQSLGHYTVRFPDGSQNTTCGFSSTVCGLSARTETNMETATQTKPITENEWNLLNNKVTSGNGQASDAGTTTDRTNAAEPLGAPGTQTPAQKEAEESLCVAGGGTGCRPVRMPQPNRHETAISYRERLRALGFLGTITLAYETYIFPRVVPEGVLRIEPGITPPTPIPFYDPDDVPAPWIPGDEPNPTGEPWPDLPPEWMPEPEAWPGNDPEFSPDVGITIVRNPREAPNPETFPEPPPPGTGPEGIPPIPPPVPSPEDGECGPTIPTINVEPLEEIDFGSKFPFGIFSWVASALSPLTAAPLTPEFDVPIVLPGVGDGSIHIDLSPADPYMSMMRLLASIGIAIAAVYLFASSILGFRAGNAGGGLDADDV